MRKPHGCVLVGLTSAVFFGGCVTGGCAGASRTQKDPARAVYAELPHHVAPGPDAASFRFAMVHDVIHERYPRHGPAYYEERERLAREAMAVLHRDSETAYALTDDIAVGLDRRGRTDEAITLMRDKLQRQQAIGLGGKELYSTYANLGEFLVHENVWAMCAGDAGARKRFLEGYGFLLKSIEVRPNAHFGREQWQRVALDFLMDAGEQPLLVRRCDLIGNRLDRVVEFQPRAVPRFMDGESEDIGRPYLPRWAETVHERHRYKRQPGADAEGNGREAMRKFITSVGGESAKTGTDGRRGRRGPFDEPALWLIGEWRQGAGPNPHFAVCLGEIMFRVGQRYLAWSCYERASRMAQQFWPSAEAQEFLRIHCKRRQTAIEKTLPTAEVVELRPTFDSQLAFGNNYQRDYQVYEEERIRSGSNLNDLHFFDEFHAGRAPIASKVGPEEWYAGEPGPETSQASFRTFWEWGLLTGGACILLAALIANWIYGPRHRLPSTEINPPP